MRGAVGAIGTLAAGTVLVAVGGLVVAVRDDPVAGAVLSISVPGKYQRLIEEAGTMCPEVSPNLLAALLTQESGFNPKASSPVGAQGIAQFMPSTWESSGIDGNSDGKTDVWDPEDAIPSSAKYLCSIAEDVRDIPGDKQANMLAAYNAGTGAVRQYGGVPPYKETQNYVRSITALAKKPAAGTGVQVSEDEAAIAISAADGMIGKPYSWGGGNAAGPSTGTCCSPNGSSGSGVSGFDCSGLTLYAYAQAGISLPRTAAAQYAASEPVRPEDMRAGDLIFYGSSAVSIHHVGIFLGGGYMIDAPRPGTKVRYSKISDMRDLFGVARPVSNTNKEV
ncbi:NlpC/P60 family protein [Streptomyces sp. 049-1]|uniref:bifunctional lytic transglycosylase/C40 family peptidase n=1 Tax=Streptomyces sp. 049-1 TaxID=2789264 RepID=UPI00397F690B